MADPERWERLGRARAEADRARWTMDDPDVVEHGGVRWRQVEGLVHGRGEAAVRVEAYLATGPAVGHGEATVMRFVAGGVEVYGPQSALAMDALRSDDADLAVDADLDPYADLVAEFDAATLAGWSAGYDSVALSSTNGLRVRTDAPDLVAGVEVDDRGRVEAVDYGHSVPLAVERELDHDVELTHDRLTGVADPSADALPALPDAVADRTHAGTDRTVPTRVCSEADIAGEERTRLVVGPFPDPDALDAPLADEVVWYAFPDASTADAVPAGVTVDLVRPDGVADGDLTARLAARVDAAIARERGVVRERFDDVRDAVGRVTDLLDDSEGDDRLADRLADHLDDADGDREGVDGRDEGRSTGG